MTTAGSGRHQSVAETTVFKVTNLNASGVGSLQECVYAKGPRTCVFEVSGTIDLTGDRSYGGSEFINLKNPYITIAGQTAPSPGVTVKGKTLRIEAHDVLIQHVRFRVGDSPQVAIRPEVRDTVLIAGKNGDEKRTPHNIVIDHCSFSWGIDEVFSIKDSSHSITLSNSIISEGLDRSLHPKGRHSKGLMAVGDRQSFHRNLIANVQDRAPLDISPNSQHINNLNHNTKYATFGELSRSKFYADAGRHRKTSVTANVRSRGSNTADRGEDIWGKASPELHQDSRFFLKDNFCVDDDQTLKPCNVENGERVRVNTPLVKHPELPVWPVSRVQDRVLKNVGARPVDRDAVDQRIINEVSSNTGRVPDCVSAEPIYYPVGNVANHEVKNILLDLGHCYAGRFNDQVIEIFEGTGQGQTRTVTQHLCNDANKNELIVDRAWTTKLDATSRYRIRNSCANNAGGWPVLKENNRALIIPDNSNQLAKSGYTRLEEYLHEFYKQVEAKID